MIYFLDTNIYIYALEDKGQKGIKARKLLLNLEKNRSQVFTSVITVMEVMTGVHKRKLSEISPKYLEFLGNSTIIEISRNIALEAAKIRAIYNLKTPDAIQIACALSCRANFLVTADKRISRKTANLQIKVL